MISVARVKKKLYLLVVRYFQLFANISLMRWRPRVIAVTGSVGKTTLLNLLEKHQIDKTVKRIIYKFKTIPNTGHMQIWLQRAIIKLSITQKSFDESICKLISSESISLWNNDWLNSKHTKMLEDRDNIINQSILDNLDAEIQDDEVLLFGEQSL